MNVGNSHVALRTGEKEGEKRVNLLAANKRLKMLSFPERISSWGAFFFLVNFFYLETLCNTSIEYTGCTITSLPPAYSIVSREFLLLDMCDNRKEACRAGERRIYVRRVSESVCVSVCLPNVYPEVVWWWFGGSAIGCPWLLARHCRRGM